MKHRWKVTVSFLGLLFATLTPTHAQTGSLMSVTGTGAVSSTDGTYQVHATLGQSAIGIINRGGGNLSQGFWHSLSHAATTSASEMPTTGSRLMTLAAIPNPFSGSTRISVTIPHEEHISVTLHDLLGQPIRTLLEGEQQKGEIALSLNADDLPAGRYTLTLKTAKGGETIPLLLVK